jgi:probable F420-dependent oxidoreductase
VKVGIVPINVSVRTHDDIIALVTKAEEVGLESLWTFEHTIVPVEYASRYPYSPQGKMGAAPETVFVDPLIALSFAAAHSKTLKLATGVNILPQANPLLLAKQAASIDFVSNGRLLLGLGTGWLREEYEALGTPFEHRGARFDDYIAAMKKVWSGEVVEHRSEFLHWTNFKSFPVPVQRPHPPLIIGGSTGPAVRRVVQHGQGWFIPGSGPAELRKQIAEMHALCREHGRDPASIELTAMWPYAAQPDALASYEELGIARLVVMITALGTANPIKGLEKLGDRLAKR